MAKPELLTVPEELLANTRKIYEEAEGQDDGLVLEILAEFHLNNLLEFDGFPNPQAAYEDLRDYMVTMFEIYRRQTTMTSDGVTQELIGEIILNFWPVFQPTKEAAASAMTDFCETQMNYAKTNNDQPTWHKWSLIQQSLQSFISS